MSDITPNPTPQDAATTTPQSDATPQTLDQSTVPAQAAPVAPTQATTPTEQPPATAQPPAATGAQAAPQILPKHGLMASVLMGALGAATAAMKVAGKGAQAIGEVTRTGQDIKTQNLARAKTRQDMQIAQQKADIDKQKAQQEQVAALDEHQIKTLTANSMSMDNMHKAAENAQIEKLFPLKTAEEKETLMGQIRAQNDVDRKFFVNLADAVGPAFFDKAHFAPGGAFEQLTTDHATNVGQGKSVAISNGLTGPDADLAFASVIGLENTLLDSDQKVVTDWNLNPQTGEMTPTYTTLQAGHNTWWDAAIAHDSGMDKFNQKQEMYDKLSSAKQKAAQAEQEKSVTQLNEAQAKQLNNMGIAVPPGYTPDANNFSLSSTGLQQKLTSQGIKVPNDFQNLYAIGHYKSDVKGLPTTLRKGVGGTTQDNAKTFVRAFVNPNYDDGNLPAVKNMEKEFAETRSGTAGGNLIAFNTATGHLGQLYDAGVAMQNGNLVKLNQVANALGIQTGQSAPLVFNAIRGALVGELGRVFKGTAADIPEREEITNNLSNANSPQAMTDLAKQYAHLMLTKAGANVAHYYAYTGELPPQTIDPGARDVYQRMGIDPASVLPGGASAPVGGTGNVNPSANSNTVPQGKVAVYSKSTGQLKGYADDSKLTNFKPF